METWKPIPNYEGIYEASNLGRIRSCVGKTTSNSRYATRVWKSRIIKEKELARRGNNGKKDHRVCLWKDGAEKTYLVSRLVASAWHGEPKDGMTVNHINGNSSDNRAENLEWVSLQDNINHGWEHGLYDSLCNSGFLVDEIGNRYSFRSKSEASRFLGRNNTYVANSLYRGTKIRSLTGQVYKWEGAI